MIAKLGEYFDLPAGTNSLSAVQALEYLTPKSTYGSWTDITPTEVLSEISSAGGGSGNN